MNDNNIEREEYIYPQKSSNILFDAIITETPPKPKSQIQIDNVQPIESKVTKAKKIKKVEPKKLLSPYADWVIIVTGVTVLSQTEGMGHHLGHTGLLLLMLALVARPIRPWWDAPLKHRRTIGIVAFAAALAHSIYAISNILSGNIFTIFSMSALHQSGMWAGIISLAMITPAAVTSFKYMQRKLGKNWRKIHLLTVPALGLAVLHTVLIGPHYLADFKLEIIDCLRICGVIILSLTIFLLRKPIVLSALQSNKFAKSSRSVGKVAPERL